MVTEHAGSATPNRNEEVVLRFMRLMDGNPSDLDVLDPVLAPDLRLHLGSAHLDLAQTKDFIRMVYAAFRDYTHTPEEILSVGERVVLRTTNRATHTGDLQGIAATGRRISFGQVAIYRMVDAKIAEIWEDADLFGLMQQLGATVTSEPFATLVDAGRRREVAAIATRGESTQQVFEHHLRVLGAGDLDGILSDYTDDSILIRAEGPVKGRQAIRGFFQGVLASLFRPGTYEFTIDMLHFADDVAYVVWHANCTSADIVFAADTFVINNGKIAVQTFAAQIRPKR
jgi:predicted ester cyclase/ketosteroid isomerase-like protein